MIVETAARRAEERGAFDALRALSFWLMSGPPLWLAWLFTHDDSNSDEWTLVGKIWLFTSNLFVLAALFYAYWLVRADHRRRGLPPFHFKIGPGYWLIPLSWAYGALATLAVIRDLDGDPLWLLILTATTLGIALATQADWYAVLRRRGREMKRIEESLDEP